MYSPNNSAAKSSASSSAGGVGTAGPAPEAAGSSAGGVGTAGLALGELAAAVLDRERLSNRERCCCCTFSRTKACWELAFSAVAFALTFALALALPLGVAGLPRRFAAAFGTASAGAGAGGDTCAGGPSAGPSPRHLRRFGGGGAWGQERRRPAAPVTGTNARLCATRSASWTPLARGRPGAADTADAEVGAAKLSPGERLVDRDLRRTACRELVEEELAPIT